MADPPPAPPLARSGETRTDVSVVVPVFDEEPNLPILHREIRATMDATELSWEVIYVDDRSSDGSLAVMIELWRDDPHVRVVSFRNRSGQTAAMAAGFDNSRGEVVITMDGDLQNDPADIPRLLERLESGADIVAGWRRQRHDGLFLRKVPSWIANRLIGAVTGTSIHDTGCSLKAFRRQLVKNLPIYAEQHRFLPAMSAGSGARIEEIEVNHRPRRFGRSKYGLGRAMRVLLDLMTIKMISSFSQRPLQYFAAIALPFAAGTVLLLGVAAVRVGDLPRDRGLEQILLIAFLLSFMACVYFFLLGLLAELVIKASDLHGKEGGRRIVSANLARGGNHGS
jgi:glycosyltransferase involved in cell wall biosynthesis